MNKLIMMAGAAAMIAPLMSSADEYQFIINGDPVAASTVDSSKTETPSTSLVTSSRTTSTVAASLEARYRTIAPTAGIKLRSDAAKGMIISVK